MTNPLLPLDLVAKEINSRIEKATNLDLKADEMVHDIRRKAKDHRISAGLRLIEARQRVESGEAGDITWTAWCREYIKRSRQDINKCIRLAGHVDPAAALAKERDARRESMANHRANSGNVAHNDDVGDISHGTNVECDPVEYVMKLVREFSTENFSRFKFVFHQYCGGAA
jgi:hypothetical protein